MNAKTNRIGQLRSALRDIRTSDPSAIRKHGSDYGGIGINIWPDGQWTDGSTVSAMSVYLGAVHCNTKKDAIASIKRELEWVINTDN